MRTFPYIHAELSLQFWRKIHAERLSFVFDFEKREYARANFIIYFDISVILSVVFFCVTFLIYFIFSLQIPNTTKNTHKS